LSTQFGQQSSNTRDVKVEMLLIAKFNQDETILIISVWYKTKHKILPAGNSPFPDQMLPGANSTSADNNW
jgi:hypothetical protein